VQKEPAGNSTRISKDDVLLEILNIKFIIRRCSSQIRSAATITTKTATVSKEK
jgi:hypothetical protein